MGGRRRWLGGLVSAALVLVLSACGSAPAPTDAPSPIGFQAFSQGFVLQVSTPGEVWSSADAIVLMTTLTWTGVAPNGTLWGSGSGPATLAFEEVGGAGRSMGGGGTDDCASTVYARGVAVPIKPGKTAGWDAGDPNAAFYEAWARDPLLHLPPGRWRLTLGVDGYLNTCGGPPVRMSIPLEIIVR
jgi:hypothetical protein